MCDANFVVRYQNVFDLIDMHGDTVISNDGGSFVIGLDTTAIHTYRFESPDGSNYRFSVDSIIFVEPTDNDGHLRVVGQ